MLDLIWERPAAEPPQLSVLMPVYRTPAYVAEAVRSVLSQTEVVLEILISDDQSGDDTLAIALAEAKAHTGPHAIRVFRTRRRLMLDHLGTLVGAARCDFMVEAHGDDISPPGRMRTMLAHHRETGAALVTSPTIDLRNGKREPEQLPDYVVAGLQSDESILKRRPRFLQGARYGFHRRIYDEFPPLTARYLPRGHDALQPFRALLTGGVYLSADPLLIRRFHPGQWSRSVWDKRMPPAARFGHALTWLGLYAVMRTDLAHFEKAHPDEAVIAPLRARLNKEEHKTLAQLVAARHELRVHGFEPQWRRLAEIDAGNATSLPWPPSEADPRPARPNALARLRHMFRRRR